MYVMTFSNKFLKFLRVKGGVQATGSRSMHYNYEWAKMISKSTIHIRFQIKKLMNK